MYVVIGAGGFLGSQLVKSILEKTDKEVLAVARTESIYGSDNKRVYKCTGDFNDEKYLRRVVSEINNIGNADIVYTIACHNIDFVAEYPEVAKNMNIGIPDKFLQNLKSFNKMFFTSSDTVYGEGGDYLFRECDSLNPISVYGRQKADAEQIFNNYGATALRLPLMFSESVAPSKKHFCDVVTETIRNGNEIKLSTGAKRSVLDYRSVAELMLELFDTCNLPQKLNVAGDDGLSKYELGLMLAKKTGANSNLIVPVENWGNFRPGAERTESTLLDNTLVKQILDNEILKINL